MTYSSSRDIMRYNLSFQDLEKIAGVIAKSNLFGIKRYEEALALCLISQAEGRHPALAALDYSIIDGKPAKRAKAILRDFLAAGGSVEWHETSETAAEATFSHAQGGKVRIRWDSDKAKQAGLMHKGNYQKYPGNMYRARVISDGCDAVFPTSGFYPPEVVEDFEKPEPKNVTPPKAKVSPAELPPLVEHKDPETKVLAKVNPETGEIVEEGDLLQELTIEELAERNEALGKIKSLMNEHVPGNDVHAKGTKRDLLREAFVVSSWKEICNNEDRFTAITLNEGLSYLELRFKEIAEKKAKEKEEILNANP